MLQLSSSENYTYLISCSHYADVPCKRTRLGLEYNGATSVTISGTRCVSWSSLSPVLFRQVWQAYDSRTAMAAGSFCRNPDGDVRGPWCYINAAAEATEYCSVPQCSMFGLNKYNIIIIKQFRMHQSNKKCGYVACPQSAENISLRVAMASVCKLNWCTM